MIPRPSNHAHTRFAIARVNHGFLGLISQSANTSRGSRSGVSLTAVPSGNTPSAGGELLSVGNEGCATWFDGFAIAATAALPGARLPATFADASGSQNTCSSFHSLVGL